MFGGLLLYQGDAVFLSHSKPLGLVHGILFLVYRTVFAAWWYYER